MSEFISDKLEGFYLLSIEQYFHWNLLKLVLFFPHKNASISYHLKPPIQKDNSCMHSMPMFH